MARREQILIVGGGPAALAAARSYRESGGSLPVRILAAEADPPYRRPPLSKEFLRQEIGREELLSERREWYADRGIELLSGTWAAAIDPEARTVLDERGGVHAYEQCLLATGARPAVPELPGLELAGARTLRTIADSEWLAENAINSGPGPTRAVVVGSGFIGCEASVSLAMRGVAVTVATLESGPQIERLGEQVSERLQGWLEDAGVELRTGLELEGIELGERAPLLVRLGAESLDADLVLLALGVRRNGELAEDAGIELERDAVPTDERMRTSVPGLLAAGDLAFAHNRAAGRPLLVEHWGEALNQGAVAGAQMAGDSDARWAVAPGFWSTIGEHQLKYVAWGDGFDEIDFRTGAEGAFSARYLRDGELVGTLTHGADEDYERTRVELESRG